MNRIIPCQFIKGSGVVKGGRGGVTAPPIVFKTILTKSLNPCRSWGGGGGGTCKKIQTQSIVLPLKYGYYTSYVCANNSKYRVRRSSKFISSQI